MDDTDSDRPTVPAERLLELVEERPERLRSNPRILERHLRHPEVEPTMHALRACEALADSDPAALAPLTEVVVGAMDRELSREFSRAEMIANRPAQSRTALEHGGRTLRAFAGDRPGWLLSSETDAVAVLERVAGTDGDARGPALGALGRLAVDDPEALTGVADTLVDGLGATDREVGRDVARGVAAVATVAPGTVTAAVDPLVAALQEGDRTLAKAAVRALEALSSEYPESTAPAATPLVEMLQGYVDRTVSGALVDERVVEDAARIVYRLAKARPAALIEEVPALTSLLRAARRHSNHTLVSAGVVSCAHVSRTAPEAVEEAVPVVAPLVHETPVDVRNRAAARLVENVAAVRPEAAVVVSLPIEEPVTEHPELFGSVLTTLAQATGHDPEAIRRSDVESVLETLEEGDPDHREAAARILANVSTVSPTAIRMADVGEDAPSGQETLLSALDCDSPVVRTRCGEALANLAARFPEADAYDPVEGEGLHPVVDLLGDDAPMAATFGARVFAAVGTRDPTVVDVAREELEALLAADTDRDASRAAVDALCTIARESSADARGIAESLVEAARADVDVTHVVSRLADLGEVRPEAVAPVLPDLEATVDSGSITQAKPLGTCLAAVADADPEAVATPLQTVAGRLTDDAALPAARTVARVAEATPGALGPALGSILAAVRDAELADPLEPFGVDDSREPPRELLGAIAADPMGAESAAGYATRALAAAAAADVDAVADHVPGLIALVESEDAPSQALGVIVLGHVGRTHPEAVERNLSALESLLETDDLALRWYAARIVSLAADDSPAAVKRVVAELVEDLQGTGIDLESDVDPNYVRNADTRRDRRIIEWLAEVADRTPSAARPAVDVLVQILDGLVDPMVTSEDPDVPALVAPATAVLAAVAREHPESVAPATDVLGSLVRVSETTVQRPAARALAAVADADPGAVAPVLDRLVELLDPGRATHLGTYLDDVAREGVAFAASEHEATFEHPYRDWKEARHTYQLVTDSPWCLRVEPVTDAHSHYLFLGEASGHADYDAVLTGDTVIAGEQLADVDRISVLASRSPHAESQNVSHTVQFEYGVRVVEYGADPTHPHRPGVEGPPHLVFETPFPVVAAVLETLVTLSRAGVADPIASSRRLAVGLQRLTRCRADAIRRPALELIARTERRPEPASPATMAYLVDLVADVDAADRPLVAEAVTSVVTATEDPSTVRAAVAPLGEHLGADDPELRRRVADSLAGVAGEDPGAVAGLTDELLGGLDASLPGSPGAATRIAETLGHLARWDPSALAVGGAAVGALPEEDGAAWNRLPAAGQQALATVLVNLLERAGDPERVRTYLRSLAELLCADADPVATWQATAGIRAAVADRGSLPADEAADRVTAGLLSACELSADRIAPTAAADCLAPVPVPDADTLVADVRADAVVTLQAVADRRGLAGDLAGLRGPLEAGRDVYDDEVRSKLVSLLEAVADRDPERLHPLEGSIRSFARTTPTHRSEVEAVLRRIGSDSSTA